MGVTGRHDSTTAYFWGRFGWGGPVRGACAPPPEPKPEKTGPPDDKPGKGPKPSKPPKPEPPGRDPSPGPPNDEDD